MNLEPKTASLKLQVKAITGYSSNEIHRISIDQYESIQRILAGLPTADEAKLKLTLLALVSSLQGLNFGTDDDVNGGDTVDVINDYWDALVEATK